MSDNVTYRTLMRCYKPKLIRHVKELKSGDCANQDNIFLRWVIPILKGKHSIVHRSLISFDRVRS